MGGRKAHAMVDFDVSVDDLIDMLSDSKSNSSLSSYSDVSEEETKNTRRMQRNRVSAAKSRARRAAYVRDLETTIITLRGEVARLMRENTLLMSVVNS